MPIPQEEQAKILNYCRQHMHMSAFALGSSDAKAAQGGNIAFLELQKGGISVWRKNAFSNSSSLGNKLRDNFAPSVPSQHFGTLGVAGNARHANHTEPKLFRYLEDEIAAQRVVPFDTILIASQLDCCTHCLKHTIEAYQGIVSLVNLKTRPPPINFLVAEFESMRVRFWYEI